MSKCRLFIVRHTESVGNIEGRLTGRKDYPLTENGKKYVKLLTEKLKDIKFDAAYSSTSGRAEKTIEPLAILNHLKIHEKEGLCEMYFGIYNGWKWEDVNRINPQIRQTQMEINEIAGIPEQESTEETADRMYHCIQEIAEENMGKTVLIASHGVEIEAFLRKITGVKFAYEKEKYCQYNTAINELEYENKEFKILRIADMSHINNSTIKEN